MSDPRNEQLSQVISGRRFWADGTPVAGQQFEYAFDDIGNRTSTGGRESAVSTYTVNDLNQYIDRTVPDVVDVFGLANSTANVTVGITGGTASPAARHGEYYHHALTVGHNAYPEIEVQSLYGATASQTGHVFNPPATETYSHDDDGNLLHDGRWTYVWDGENRLIEMRRDDATPAGARKKLTFEYDWQGRRIRKTVFNYNNGWVEQSDTIFLYDGWNLIAELDANNGKQPIRAYVWGNDLSGTLQAAGGVGGLLMITPHSALNTPHFVAYDGNGNVMGLVAASDGTLSARYAYGPFGEPLRATGPQAANPFRFSTKYQDPETGLYYYGHRYYDPTTGRWLSRDPIGESGGHNTYAAFHNNSLTTTDPLGRTTVYRGPPLDDIADVDVFLPGDVIVLEDDIIYVDSENLWPFTEGSKLGKINCLLKHLGFNVPAPRSAIHLAHFKDWGHVNGYTLWPKWPKSSTKTWTFIGADAIANFTNCRSSRLLAVLLRHEMKGHNADHRDDGPRFDARYEAPVAQRWLDALHAKTTGCCWRDNQQYENRLELMCCLCDIPF